jgi:2-dehydropantoate 2-reductase
VPARFKSVAVVGAGAVGSFYGALLARAGHPVTLIGRAAHVHAVERGGLRLDMAGRVHVVRAAASVELASIGGADLVLFCVKSTDSAAVAREMAPLLAADAVVVSLQNGVENAPTIAKHVRQVVVPAAVYVATALVEPGVVRHFGRGELVIGALDAAAARDAAVNTALQDLKALFATAGVEVTISGDVMAELWTKLVTNCAYNAISGLAQATYGKVTSLPEVRAIQEAVVREVVALAQAEGVNLPLEHSLRAVERIAAGMPGQLSSTAQDMARGKAERDRPLERLRRSTRPRARRCHACQRDPARPRQARGGRPAKALSERAQAPVFVAQLTQPVAPLA